MPRLRRKKRSLFANIWCVGKRHPTPKFNIIDELIFIKIRRVLFSNAPQAHHKIKAHRNKKHAKIKKKKAFFFCEYLVRWKTALYTQN